MSFTLPPSDVDKFSLTRSAAVPAGSRAATISLGGVLSAVLRDDPAIKKQMTAAEQAAVEAVIKDVGTPDEYASSTEFVLRALPYVRSVYSAMDVIQPYMPSDEELSILLRSRFLTID